MANYSQKIFIKIFIITHNSKKKKKKIAEAKKFVYTIQKEYDSGIRLIRERKPMPIFRLQNRIGIL